MPTDQTYSLDDMLQAANVERLDEADRIYSSEVREIISTRPAWMVRNGIALFFIIIALLFTGSFFIQYPDIIKAPVRIVGNNLPKQVMSKSEGKLVALFVKDNDQVQEGALLGIIQSSADYEQVLLLDKWIEAQLKNLKTSNNSSTNAWWSNAQTLPALNILGDIQKNYQELTQQVYQLGWSTPKGYFEQKKQTIAKELNTIQALNQNAQTQKQLIEQDLQMQQHLLTINEGLVKEKVIAPLELNKDKSAVIAKQQQLVQVDAGTINQNNSAISKHKELIEIAKTANDIQQNFITALFNAKTAITEWKNRYMIIAAETGKIQMASYYQTNSWIKAGQELFYIIPSQPSYFAEVLASQQNFGKISKGQQVHIALNSYQRNEFGVLDGIITNIPAVPYRDTAFLIKVVLPNGLVTNYKKQILFSNNLSGIAEIITENASLADRLLYQWRGLWKR
ncbi:MAG: HlyD family efflux transporter periplasmic adaptor subunit [Sphingobacteriia bacterium]|nr:MAG: HlyD family efflux transporter periplasmic adaptor subunit [Sphingobacteriia bacterium]